MVDPGTGIALGGAAWGSKELVLKVLGPTADYLGEGLKGLTEKSANNIKNIFSAAERKVPDEMANKGQVPPKVLKGILFDGAFCDDSLAAEYFGGVLASSKSEVSRDDRGATINNLIAQLSTYQLRAHYIFYLAIKKIFDGQEINPGDANELNKCAIYISFTEFTKLMDFTKEENESGKPILIHILFGLHKESLIVPHTWGHVDHINKIYKNDAILEPGMIIKPASLGIELFLWAHGNGRYDNEFFLDKNFNPEPASKINLSSGFFKANPEKK
ncbi:MAG: hypothetical protein V3S46_02045 [Nitrospinota bacterium]